MAYKLAFNTVNTDDYVTAPALGAQPLGNYYLEVKVTFDDIVNGAQTYLGWAGGTAAAERTGFGIRYDNLIQFFGRGNTLTGRQAVNGETVVLRIAFTAATNTYTAFINGTVVGSFNNIASDLEGNGGFYLGTDSNTALGNDRFTVEYFDFIDEGNPSNSRSYKKNTISGSNDTVYPDTVGGNDGTLFNFPTNNSQWVFYQDSAPATADGAIVLPAVLADGQATATQPQPTADGAIVLPAVLADGQATATQPQPTADGAIVLPAVKAAGLASIPNGEITPRKATNIDIAAFSVNINVRTLSTNITV